MNTRGWLKRTKPRTNQFNENQRGYTAITKILLACIHPADGQKKGTCRGTVSVCHVSAGNRKMDLGIS